MTLKGRKERLGLWEASKLGGCDEGQREQTQFPRL